METAMKTIVITGSKGFVGRNLTEYLQSKNYIIPITRDTINLLDFKETKDFFENNHVDVIIHCANEGGSRKTGYDEKAVDIIANNLKMYDHLESCLTSKMKMISFGSGAQYFKNRNLVNVSEKDIGDFVPSDDYGFSKYAIHKSISNSGNVYSPIIFGLYGKYEDYRFKFISNSIIKNILHMPIVVNQNVVFDYLYLGDFLKIIDLYIENDYANRQFNITPTESIDLVTICKMINNCSNFQSEIIVKNAGLNFEYTANNAVMLEDIGGFQFTSYQDGIRDLYSYYQTNLNFLDIEAIKSDEFMKYCKVNKDEKN